MRRKNSLILVLMASLFMMSCSPDLPSDGSSVEYYPGELTQKQYESLDNEQKYVVANKLLSTIFKGIPVGDFYDLQNGMQDLKLTDRGKDLLSATKESLSKSLALSERKLHDMIIFGYEDIGGDRSISSKFVIKSGGNIVSDWPKQQPLARIMQFPLSKDMFDHYVAYLLVNTILFSPAEEIDSASIRDVQKVFNKLYDDLKADKTVSQIISRHQRTQENWRRFRSPEDNVREMIEIYLGLFDRDEDVPRAAKACQDLYLTDADDNYELLSTGFENTEPQYVLDTFVTRCNDFYDVVANHPLVIPRVTTVLVEYFFYNKSSVERSKIVENIAAAGPSTFQEIVKSILFSEEYLLNNERPKSFEESFFGVAHQAGWRPHKNLLRDLTRKSTDNGDKKMSMATMGWPTMSLKLGRFSGVPLDALSFANYHKALREVLFVDGIDGANGTCSSVRSDETNLSQTSTECDWREGLGLIEAFKPVNPADREEGGIPLTSVPLKEELDKYNYDMEEYNRRQELFNDVQGFSLNELYDYLFMSIVQRRATDLEKTELTSLIRDTKTYIRENPDDSSLYIYININDSRREHKTNYDEVAKVVFDYISRLPETYYYHTVSRS